MDAVSSRSHRRLVLIDDDDQLLRAMRFAFEAEGYFVTAFSNGEAALQSPPLEPRTCLVVDERLPGVSGLETIARLRKLGVTAPAILVTSYPTSALKQRADAARVVIVEKPLLGDSLASKIDELLGPKA